MEDKPENKKDTTPDTDDMPVSDEVTEDDQAMDNTDNSSEEAKEDSDPVAQPSQPPAPAPALVEGLLVNKPQKSKKSLWILLALLAVVAVGALTYYLLMISTPEPTPAASKSPTPTPKPLTAETLVNEVKSKLAGEQLEVAEKTLDGAARTKDGTWVYGFAYRQLEGNAFKNLPTTGHGVGVVGDAETADKDYETITSFLKEKGLDEEDSTTGEDGLPQRASALYASDSIICYVSKDEVESEKVQSSLGCGDVSSYKEAAVLLQPFYDAYAEKNQESAEGLSFSLPEIKDGADGYQNASVQITRMTGLTGLFYKVPDQEWAYFTGTQELLSCTQYDTPDLKKAFAGSSCSDEAGMAATVEV